MLRVIDLLCNKVPIFKIVQVQKMHSLILGNENSKVVDVFVLDNQSPETVAQAMIESGRQNNPFYIFCIDEAYRRIKHFNKMMPRVQIFYAMKANDCEMMLRLAASLGLGFDCASPGEIYKVKRIGVNPLSIIYAVPAKSPKHIIYARESGVKHTTFDTLSELVKIKQYWPDAKLLIRIHVDSDSVHQLGKKFGCDYETDAIDLLEKAADLGVQVVGVAFHVGSVCFSSDSYVEGLRRAKSLFDHEARAGRQLTIIDIGGGFLSDRTDRIDQVSKYINSTLEELFPDPSVQVIAEPGRYICDSAFTHYCNINNVRKIEQGDKPISIIYLNDGLFGTMRWIEASHTVKKFKRSGHKNEDEELEEVFLYGLSLIPDDCVMAERTVLLPRCTSLDWLVLANRGAYSLVCATQFCSHSVASIRHVISMQLWQELKDNPMLSSTNFVTNPNISEPLQLTPPLLSTNEIDTISLTYTLKC